MYCRECGAKLPDGGNFRPCCGKRRFNEQDHPTGGEAVGFTIPLYIKTEIGRIWR